MADARCPHNDGHSSQVRTFAGQLARALGLRETELYRVEDGALLHDIGKIRVSDVVLRKPGPLSREETLIVAAHPLHGANMLLHAPHLADLIPIVRSHHEQFDGSGYPDGLKGERNRARREDRGACGCFRRAHLAPRLSPGADARFGAATDRGEGRLAVRPRPGRRLPLLAA